MFILCNAQAQHNVSLELSPMFSSNMVLQQGMPTPVWGNAKPGRRVTVNFNTKRVVTTASAAGKWMLKLPVQNVGGPYTMVVIQEADSIVLNNVMIGEVWVCSGQSNMEMPVGDWGKVNNYTNEIAASNFPDIRLFHIKKSASNTPEENPELYDKEQWQECSPATIKRFSAAAYFFAKNIQTKHHIPIGLIQSTYGGTVAEAWVSSFTLQTMPDFTNAVKQIKQQSQKQLLQDYWSQLKNWLQYVEPLDSGFENKNPVWANDLIDITGWQSMQLPAYFDEAGLPEFKGIVWFKKKITISPEAAKNELKISIGSVGDEDVTFFNGVEIGRSNIAGKRIYNVPSGLIHSGENIITIRLIVYKNYASIYGEGETFSITTSAGDILSLAGGWRYKIGYNASLKMPPGEPGDPNRATVLYNAMINPIVPFGIRGVLWYQGEYNVGRAKQYQTLFPLLINDWRYQWNQGNFPFYFVQLANYKNIDSLPVNSDWAELREAQTYALRLPNTAMATAIDIGEAEDIHPKNKQEVGARLALIARSKLYGEYLVYSGPQYKSHTILNNKVSVSFTRARSGLQAKGDSIVSGFAIAGNDHVFHWAKAHIVNDKVIVSSDRVKHPKFVRYAWSNNPVCNLYNAEELPAVPFRTDR